MKRTALALILCSVWSASIAETQMPPTSSNGESAALSQDDVRNASEHLVTLAVQEKDKQAGRAPAAEATSFEQAPLAQLSTPAGTGMSVDPGLVLPQAAVVQSQGEKSSVAGSIDHASADASSRNSFQPSSSDASGMQQLGSRGEKSATSASIQVTQKPTFVASAPQAPVASKIAEPTSLISNSAPDGPAPTSRHSTQADGADATSVAPSPQQAVASPATVVPKVASTIKQGTSSTHYAPEPMPEPLKLPPPTGARKGVPSINLPGVGTMPGSAPELQNNVIRVTTDRTEIVNVSGTLTNRIATPFANPKAIMLEGAATVQAVNQSLYVALNGSPTPISLYVTGAGANDPVVSITLVPKSMPPQTIVLQMDGAQSGGANGNVSTREENVRSEVYTERIVATLRSLALGKVPPGFAEGRLPSSAANMGSVIALPISRFSGPSFDVYRYRVNTVRSQAVEMEESAFWTKGVRAVAFYPTAIVKPGVPTDVFVVADKSATVGGIER